jgi:hypothetical protein
MRGLEIAAAIIAGLILLVVLKVIGVVLKIAIWGFVLGAAIGFVAARALRKST